MFEKCIINVKYDTCDFFILPVHHIVGTRVPCDKNIILGLVECLVIACPACGSGPQLEALYVSGLVS